MENEETKSDEFERPLSPVFGSNRTTRKPRVNKKRRDLGKLVDKLEEKQAPTANCFLDDTLTVSQAECIGKLEKLEEAKEESHKTRKVLDGVETAAGRKIHVSNKGIKTQAALFRDILSGSEQVQAKKYSFLTKTERYRTLVENSAVKGEIAVIESENESVINTKKFVVDGNYEPVLNKKFQGLVEGSATRDKKNEVLGQHNEKQGIFSIENFDDLKLNEQFQGFVKSSVIVKSENLVPKARPVQKVKQNSVNGNFDDLFLDKELQQGFVKGSTTVMRDTRRAVPKAILKNKSNIFANEYFGNFSLDNKFQGFVTATVHTKSQNVGSSASLGSPVKKNPVLFTNKNCDDINLNAKFAGFIKSPSIIVEQKKEESALESSNKENFNNPAKIGNDFYTSSSSAIGTLKKIDENDFKGFDENEITASQIEARAFLTSIEAAKEGNGKRRLSFKDDLPAIKKSKPQEDQAEKPVFLSEGSLRSIREGSLAKRSASSPGLPITSANSSAPSTTKKKRLGISHCKPMQLSKEKLARARLIFDDGESIVPSPVKSHLPQPMLCSTPVRNTRSNVLLDSTLTPIKYTSRALNTSTPLIKETSETSYNLTYSKLTFAEESKKVVNEDSRFVLQQPSRADVELRNAGLEEKRVSLENELKVVFAKQKALSQQKTLLDLDDHGYRRKRTGVLSAKKQEHERVSLKTLRFNPVCCEFSNVTSQNADFFHFTGVNNPSITTADGAIIIPDLQNLVGLSEIEVGFRTMPGIELNLIPSGWIKNHYKWIIWKLASYERSLSDLKDCLTIENVVQQLKYRYDREIDRAERSSLRKIFEHDDGPQKRMVLCVSNVIALEDKLELELTDGWYGIRTMIDEPLCDQVARGKIKVGTKLMICGAKLLNCDGCHPLDAPDAVRMKINCNSTRRAKWYAKLGYYQSNLEPYPISLHSVLPMGGNIGCIKVFVARVYPVKYIEKQGSLSVWRNRKAEERRAADWENEKMKSIENVRKAIMKDYETVTSKSLKNRSLSKSELTEITCPEALYNYYKQCSDPESLNEILTESQIRSIKDYDINLRMQKEKEMSSKLRERLVNVSQRDVTSVLSLLIVDAVTRRNSGFVFHIWRPTETHIQIIQEGCIYNVYNVLPKRNGDLSSTSWTKFKAEQAQTTAFDKFKRTVLEISMTCERDNGLLSNEFDTVGVVVQSTISNFNQNFWLCDVNGRLLFVKIYEGPKSCSLLDHLKNGQVVAVSNLKLCETKHEFGQAIANHFTIISSYPRFKHLQEGIEKFSNAMSSKDVDILLTECNEKISYYLDKIDVMKSKSNSSSFLETTANAHASSVLDESCEESTLVYSRITSTDVAMSMIDIDKYT